MVCCSREVLRNLQASEHPERNCDLSPIDRSKRYRFGVNKGKGSSCGGGFFFFFFFDKT